MSLWSWHYTHNRSMVAWEDGRFGCVVSLWLTGEHVACCLRAEGGGIHAESYGSHNDTVPGPIREIVAV